MFLFRYNYPGATQKSEFKKISFQDENGWPELQRNSRDI